MKDKSIDSREGSGFKEWGVYRMILGWDSA